MVMPEEKIRSNKSLAINLGVILTAKTMSVKMDILFLSVIIDKGMNVYSIIADISVAQKLFEESEKRLEAVLFHMNNTMRNLFSFID